ncbi:4'-phosphopantetheinyl transferase superfamily protein [Streptomyces sp. NPDC051219]|uniref:4'-phosphopantetheinyl transferase family protein n=1 Tax=Streptomyces sp. NPDC051219 TaxID=3155283 RepID=UPI00342558C7
MDRSAAAGLSVGPLLPESGRLPASGRWGAVRENARRHGYALCHGRLADWASAPCPPARELLGADWSRYQSTREPTVRARLFGSRLLLRQAVAAAGDADPAGVVLGRGTHGRPLVRAPAGFDGGISHTAGLLLVGVARGRRIGVDVEAQDRPLLTPGLPERVCHPDELAALATLPYAERNRMLVRLWTLKEAYAKALGIGLGLDFSGVRFEPGQASRDGGLWHCPAAPDWRFTSGTVAGHFLVACAVGPCSAS